MTAQVAFEHTPSKPVIFHEYANLFPMLQGAAQDELREDVRKHGVREPIVFLGEAILDGRNRYMAARDLGIEYPRVEFEGDDPLAFVISTNLHRRHLSESQRAMVAAKLAKMERGGDMVSEQSANLRNGPTQSDAAEMLNVSRRAVQTARKVENAGTPEIIGAVEDGRISVSLASKVVDLPDEAKADIVSAPPEAIREVARDAVKKAHVANNSGNNEWYTPAAFIDAAKAVMGAIDLDPASSEIANQTVQAATFFTAEQDGLAQDWPVARIWMNPPYAQPLIGQFASKFGQAIRDGSEGIVLVNNATETGWFHEIADGCAAICFPKGRIKFLDTSGNAAGAPLQGQAIIYSGPNADAFEAEFKQFGLVVRHG